MSKGAAQRLRIDLKRFNDDPTPLFLARPIESNILEWRFVMQGAPDTPYAGGYYHGKLIFPTDYPWKPPSVMMITPSGRFKTNTRICLSISDFHPESWCPSYTVGTILTGLISFFNSEESTVGSIDEPVERRRELAAASHDFNMKDRIYVELFGKEHPDELFAVRANQGKTPGGIDLKESTTSTKGTDSEIPAAQESEPPPTSASSTSSSSPIPEPAPPVGIFRKIFG